MASQRPCAVHNCTTPSRYECPRCNLYYCTASCYTAHSNLCVSAFHASNSQPNELWKGRKASQYEQQSFRQILRRIKDTGFANSGGYEDGDIEIEEDDVVDLGQGVDLGEEGTGEEGDEDDNGKLLETFMGGLDHQQRELLFGLLDQGMSESVRRGSGNGDVDIETDPVDGQGTGFGVCQDGKVIGCVNGERREGGNQPDERQGVNHGHESNAGDMTDQLEQLASDMNAFDMTYEQILERLPKELVQEFERRIREGGAETENMIVLWKPWWIVEETGEKEGEVLDEKEVEEGEMPPLPRKAELLVPVEVPRRGAAEGVLCSVVEVLIGYCYVLRRGNGEWRVQAVDAARGMWEVCAVLGGDRRYGNVMEACGNAMKRIIEREGREVGLEVMRDVVAVVSGLSDWVARALFECQRMFQEAAVKVERGGRKEVKKRVRKVAYFVSWALCQQSESFIMAAREVLAFVEMETGRAEEMRIAKRAVQIVKERQNRPLITVVK